MKFSIVIPTRHRPEFLKYSLIAFRHQSYSDFEVIVCDNYTDESLSCKSVFDEVALAQAKYFRPSKPLGMVENWNYALSKATGDFVGFLTDKMLMLPNTLALTNKILQKRHFEIVNWVDDLYLPNAYEAYFGKGIYLKTENGNSELSVYNPLSELSKKGAAIISRGEMSKTDYATGKILFGVYSRDLINRIVKKYGKVFHNIAPDYTSTVLGLSEAKSGCLVDFSGVLHINTNISNGGLSMVRDERALSFLKELEEFDSIMNELVVPRLYACQHNIVGHDYCHLRNKFDLNFDFNLGYWLTYIDEDFNVEGRIWSSSEVETAQKKLFDDYLKGVPKDVLDIYIKHKEQRQLEKLRLKKEAELILFEEEQRRLEKEREDRTLKRKVKNVVSSLTPKPIHDAYLRLRYPDLELPEEIIQEEQEPVVFDNIIDALIEKGRYEIQ